MSQDITPSRRRYTDEEQAEALAMLESNGGNVFATARELDIPETTIRQWKYGTCRPVPAELRERKKLQLAQSCDKLARKMLRQANRKVKDMGGRDAVISAAVLIDKAAFLRGEGPGGAGASGGNITVNVNAASVSLTREDIEAAKRLMEAPRVLKVQENQGNDGDE